MCRSDKWLVVCTKPRSEETARRNLDAQGFETYLPQFVRESRRRDRARSEPLFPGYLFLRQNEERSLLPVTYTRGVRSLVQFGAQLASIDADLIDAIRFREAERTGTPEASRLTRGTSVEFVSGPLQTVGGVFQSYDGTDRARVMISWLGREREVSVPLSDVR